MRELLRRPARARWVVALVCAVAALGAAVAAAVGPAIPDRAIYSWPPSTLPDAEPTRLWFTPLLLITRTPRALEAHVPCTPGPALTGASDPLMVLATARDARGEGALSITYSRRSRTTAVRIGAATLAELDGIPPIAACSIDVRIDGNRWEIRRSGTPTRSGELEARPVVNGLVSQLDLASKPDLRVTVDPETQDTHPSSRQTVLRVLAALLIAAALWLALKPGRPGRPGRPAFTLPDASVLVTLATWWLIGPIYFDDGWVEARQTNAQFSGGFSNYFDSSGANLPLGTWLEWLQQFLLAETSSLVVQRIPSMICLALLWLVCRSALTRVIGPPSRSGDATLWTAALTFSVGAAAFGITLRPEPMLALLAAGALACAMRFAARPSLTPLAAAVLLVGLAVTEHPAGLAAAAPLIACLPAVVREARSCRAFDVLALGVVLVGGLAWTILLGFLDTDISQRRADASTIRGVAGGHDVGPLQEWQRYYVWLWRDSAPPLRREFVVVCVLCVLALLLNRHRRRSLLEWLPAASVGIGLVLLAFAPSKWIWHYGGFVGLATIAAGTEVAWLRARKPLTGRVGLVVATSVLIATVIGILVPFKWGPIDIRSFSWFSVPFGLAAVIPALLILAWVVRAERSKATVTWQPALWYLPLALATLLAITTVAFVADAAATSGWTATRQALSNLAHRETCGLADEIVLPVPASIRPLRPANDAGHHGQATTRNAPTPGTTVLGPGPAEWYRLESGRAGVYVGGTWRRSERLRVTWGRLVGGRVVSLSTGRVGLRDTKSHGVDPAPWRLLAQASFPPRPALANAVRFELVTVGAHSRALVSSPVTYTSTSLTSLLSEPRRLTLASPYLLSTLPCADLPEMTFGVVEPPTLMVEYPTSTLFVSCPTCPFAGVTDLYELRRLPLADSRAREDAVSVRTAAVDSRDAVAPATRQIR